MYFTSLKKCMLLRNMQLFKIIVIIIYGSTGIDYLNRVKQYRINA